MKSIAKKLVVTVLVLSTSLGMANASKTIFENENPIEKGITRLSAEPFFINKGNGVMFLNLLNLIEGKVVLKVLDSEGDTVYKESIDGELVVEKAFNFTKADAGTYTIVVVDYYGTYKKTIKI